MLHLLQIAAQAFKYGTGSVVLVATSKEMLHNLNALTRLFIPEASMAGFSIAMPLLGRESYLIIRTRRD